GAKKPLLSDDLLGRMYRSLAEARKLAEDAKARARVNDLVLYAHYVELYSDYSAAEGAARQQAFEALIRHAYRMRKTMMVHAKALYRDLVNRDRSVSIPKDATWNVPEGKNAWKSSAPFSEEELAGLVIAGIERRKLFDFEPVAFSGDLIPADRLKLPDVTP